MYCRRRVRDYSEREIMIKGPILKFLQNSNFASCRIQPIKLYPSGTPWYTIGIISYPSFKKPQKSRLANENAISLYYGTWHRSTLLKAKHIRIQTAVKETITSTLPPLIVHFHLGTVLAVLANVVCPYGCKGIQDVERRTGL